MACDPLQQSTYLSVLSRSAPSDVKALADELIPLLTPVEVLRNRTGLTMLPMGEPVQGARFYVGEVLVSEAHVRAWGAEGYAACLGRDLEQALAIALVDAAVSAGVARERIAEFVRTQMDALAEEDRCLLHAVEATRVDMETF